VHYVLLVHVLERLNHLADVVGRLLLIEATLWRRLELLVNFSLAGELEDKHDFVAFGKEAVHLEEVLVAHVTLDLDLSSQL